MTNFSRPITSKNKCSTFFPAGLLSHVYGIILTLKLILILSANQNWCTIRVDLNEERVKCPDSELNLKVHVLKKAAELAAKEKTTVRIPINFQTEVQNFGVYAVPGLETHVFVGPFTCKRIKPVISHPDEIITLESDDDEAPRIAEKQPLENIDTKKIRQEAIMGQIPQRIDNSEIPDSNPDSNPDPVKINPEDEDKERDLHPTKMGKTQYLNPSKNPHGRVVYTADPNQRKDFYEKGFDHRIKSVEVENYGVVRMFMGKLIIFVFDQVSIYGLCFNEL